MERNFDLQKYDKKAALNYRWLGEFSVGGVSENCAALYGEVCHFSYSGRLPENSEKIFNAIVEQISGDCLSISVRELCEASAALTEYSVCAQNENASAIAARALNFVRARLNDCSIEDKFFAVEASALHYAATKSAVAKEIFDCLLKEFDFFGDSANLSASIFQKNGEKSLSVEAFLRFARGVLNYAVYSDEQNMQNRAEEMLDCCLSGGLTLNYCAKNDFFNATHTDCCATAIIFSLAVKFYKLLGNQKYLHFARRIWYNGLQFCQRAEGFAGFDFAVLEKKDRLSVVKYADVRASGYYAEALAVYCKNKQLFSDSGEGVFRDDLGRIFMGDKLFAREESGFFGKDLIEIPTMTAFEKDVALQLSFNLFP